MDSSRQLCRLCACFYMHVNLFQYSFHYIAPTSSHELYQILCKFHPHLVFYHFLSSRLSLGTLMHIGSSPLNYILVNKFNFVNTFYREVAFFVNFTISVFILLLHFFIILCLRLVDFRHFYIYFKFEFIYKL